MDRIYGNALQSMKKAQNEKRLLQILHVIRKNISTQNSVQNLDKIRALQKEGCVTILVKYLKDSTNEEIINIILSIVGYACLQSEVAKALIQKYQILPILCDLMDSHNVDSIQGRIFRIMGNLCEGWNSNLVIENTPQICKPLKSYFIALYEEDETNSKSSAATITMALRASRKLLRKKTALVIIDDEKILQHIAAVFVKYSNQWIGTKQNEIILEDILKVVLHYSTFSNKEVVTQFRSTSAGDSLALLPDLIPLNPQRILRIVMNLTTFCPNKSDLPILNMMIKLNQLALLTFERREQEQHITYLHCLSNLLDHPGHKEYVEKSGTIDVFLNLFSSHKFPSRHSVACLNIIIDFLKKLPMDRFSTLSLLNNNVTPNYESTSRTSSTNNETIDLTINATKKCRCSLKRDHSKSESISTYNLRRNCNSFNCTMKVTEASETSIEESKIQAVSKDESTDNERHNFLKILIAKLQWLKIKSSNIHLPIHGIQKENSFQPIDAISLKEKDSFKNVMFDYAKEDCGYFQAVYSADERCISPSTSSDISSNGPYSPCRAIMKDDDSNSDDYSPICSDAEDSESLQFSEDLNIRDSNGKSTEIKTFEEEYSKDLRDGIIKLCCNINSLLNTLVIQKDSSFGEKMATTELCTVLLNASFQYVRFAVKTVLKIINTRLILMDFMFSDFILNVTEFTLTVHADCTVCSRAKEHCINLLQHCTNIIEDGSFKPNILYRITLQKRNGALKANFVMTSIILISGNYIVKKYPDLISSCNMNLLKRILVNDGGGGVFLSSLRSPSLISLHCLCKLVSNVIRIKNPIVNTNIEIERKYSINYNFKTDSEAMEIEQRNEDSLITADNNSNCNEKNRDHFVTFIFDDDTKIRTNRELLISKSDYFSRLLEGDFIESKQSEIRLKNVKRNPFQFLIHLLSLNLTPPCTFTFRPLDLDAILDVILMADLYLLSDIACALTMYVEQKVLSSKTILQIYRWSLNSRTDLLRIEVVAFLMSKEVQDQRVPMLQTFIDAGLWTTLLDDIASLVTRHLQALK